jgi:hypothetical protein
MSYSAERTANGHILLVFLIGTLILEEPSGIDSILLPNSTCSICHWILCTQTTNQCLLKAFGLANVVVLPKLYCIESFDCSSAIIRSSAGINNIHLENK